MPDNSPLPAPVDHLDRLALGMTAIALLGWIADTMGGRTVMVVGGVTCLVAAALGSIATAN